MRRGLPKDRPSAREARIRKAAPTARGKSSAASPAPWWHQALLWAMFLASLPLVNVNAADTGLHIARAFAPAACAFFGLWMSYMLALRFAKSAAALIATVTIWLASSLPVYMYATPFGSQAPILLATALALTLWLSVRWAPAVRWRWLVFGLASGVAIAVFITSQGVPPFQRVSRAIWASTFSADHGAFVWTPVLLVAACGLVGAVWRQPPLGAVLLVAGALFVYLVAAVEDRGSDAAAYGNRYLVPLVPAFLCGLAALIDALVGNRSRFAWASAVAVSALLILWNMGLMLQWGTGLIPNDRALDIRQAAANQVTVVPNAAKGFVVRYINERKSLVSGNAGGARE